MSTAPKAPLIVTRMETDIPMTDSEPGLAPFTLRLLGPFKARLLDAPLPHLRTRKGAWLLALLALRAGQPLDRDALAALLWPDSLTSQALASLRKSLKDLRRALGPQAHRLHAPTPRSLALDLEDAAVDLLAFDAAVARGEDGRLIASSLMGLGVFMRARGEYAAAEACFTEQVGIARAMGDRSMVPMALLHLATVRSSPEGPGAGRPLLEEAVTIARDTNNRAMLGVCLLNLGIMAQAQQDVAAADRYFRDSLLIEDGGERSHPQHIWIHLTGLAGVALARGKRERAARLLGAAATLGGPGSVWSAPELMRRIGYERLPAAWHAALGLDEEAGSGAVESAPENREPCPEAAAWAAGQRMTLAEAVEFAMGWAEEPVERRPAPS